ncbi:MAG: ABC transporter permease [Bacillota bacterium]
MNNFKSLIRTKEVIFWTLLYPIALATFFYLAFSNLGSAEQFEKVNVAVVNDAHIESGTPFYFALSSVSDIDGKPSKDDIFNATMTDKKTAVKMLENGDVAGYIYYDDTIKLSVSGSGFNQTIIKAFLDSYLQSSSTITQIMKDNPGMAHETLLADLSGRTAYIAEAPGNEPDTTVIYFYTLLAMTCMFAATVGVQEVIKIQANLSPLAARINLAPVRKFKVFLYSLSAAAFLQFIIILLVLAFVIFVLGINFGAKTGLVILTCAVGCITGMFFGTFVSSVVKKGEGIKYAVVISVTMFCSFLAGMMGAQMKYVVQENVPVLGYLNPVNLITDAFYSLYYYDGLSRYFVNIVLLCAFSAVFCILTCMVLRRQKYASI